MNSHLRGASCVLWHHYTILIFRILLITRLDNFSTCLVEEDLKPGDYIALGAAMETQRGSKPGLPGDQVCVLYRTSNIPLLIPASQSQRCRHETKEKQKISLKKIIFSTLPRIRNVKMISGPHY